MNNYKKTINGYILEDENNVMHAEITYKDLGDGILIIDHTYVSPLLRGKGIASTLVKLVVDQAKKENKKIIPLCPYAKKEFEHNKEYQKIEYHS